jgi:hypothetical protein
MRYSLKQKSKYTEVGVLEENKQGTDLDFRWSLARYSPASTSYTVHRNENPIIVFPEMKLWGLLIPTFMYLWATYSQDRSAYLAATK